MKNRKSRKTEFGILYKISKKVKYRKLLLHHIIITN